MTQPPSSLEPTPAPSLVLRVDVQNLPRTVLVAGRSGQLSLRVPADLAFHELKTALQERLVAVLDGDMRFAHALDFDVELYEPRVDRFRPLTSASQLGRRSRLNVILRSPSGHDSGDLGDNGAVLALPARMFAVDTHAGGFRINGHAVFIDEVENSGQGTGLTTWDGSVVLAKYLEHKFTAIGGFHPGMRIVEVGAGTGLVGLSAALIGGAQHVILTDLAYTMTNLNHNIQRTMAQAPRSSIVVEAQVLDWFKPRSDFGDVDLILASDVVWVEELIAPLVDAMHTIATTSTIKTTILMSHQQRSVVSDATLFQELKKNGFELRGVTRDELHPAFVSDNIHVWEITLR